MKKLTNLLFVFLWVLIGLWGAGILWEQFEKNEKSDFPAGSAPEKLEIIDIDRVVQNCSIKNKQGAVPDGLGGGGFPEILFKNGKLMIGYWGSVENWDMLELRPFNREEDHSYFSYSWAKFALEQAAKSQLLSIVDYAFYDDGQLYCYPRDRDCKINYAGGAWSDESWNYFVAGTKEEYYWTVYEINGKLYHPNRSYVKDGRLDKAWEGQPVDSYWFFGGVENGKILVKRYLNYRVFENQEVKVVDEYGERDFLKSDYQLQTCEIPL